MPAPRICPDCGSELPARTPEGLCPRCLLKASLANDALSAGRGGELGAMSSLNGWGGVLETLSANCGAVPRVLLRDTDAGLEPPVVRPGRGQGDDSTRYRIDGEIARGGMGAVLKGRDPDLGRDVAIKVLNEDLCDDPDMVCRFVEEAQIGGQLQHPGIVPIYELGAFADRRPFFSMKLVKGHTLAGLLADRGHPSDGLPRFLAVFESIAQTVAYAHARGVIHRDLKPSNVMIGSFGEVQVMDWGLAKVLPRGGIVDDAAAGKADGDDTVIATARSGSGDSDLSRAGSVLGTPSYMAPEQARGEIDRIDERADVFALGSILCEILTGCPAFVGRNSGEIQRGAALGDTADALARLDACGADPELVALAKVCLARESEDRPREAGVVSARVTAYEAGVQQRLRSAERDKAVAEARAVEERRRRRLQAGLAAAVLALVAGAWVSARQRADRIAATTRVVDDALGKASDLRGQALAAPVGELAGWALAQAEIRRAEDAISQGAADDALRGRVANVRTELVRLQSLAEQRAKDTAAERRLLARLTDIRIVVGVVRDDFEAIGRDYADALREFGVDIEALDPKEAGVLLAGRPAAAEIIAAIDAWAAHCVGWIDFNRPLPARLIAVARTVDPDPWRNSLRALCARPPAERVETLRRLGADRESMGRQSAHALLLLTALARTSGEHELEVEASHAAWRRAPSDFMVNFSVGLSSWNKEQGITRPAQAVRFLTAAVALRPENVRAHYNMAMALERAGDHDEAVNAFRETIALMPNYMVARESLGNVLWHSGKVAEAMAEFREAIRVKPSDPRARNELAYHLMELGDLDGATGSVDDALRLDPEHGLALSTRADILLVRGQFTEVVPVLERAVARLAKTDEAAALATYSGLLPKARWLAGQADALKVAGGGGGPSSLELAARARERGRPALAARLYEVVLTVSSTRAGDLEAGYRLAAARAAALAGSGVGEDEPRPADAERAEFRRLALDWLRADLTSWTKRLAADPKSGSRVVEALGRWRQDRDLAGVRDADTLAKLPGAERKDWQSLWADVDALIRRASKN